MESQHLALLDENAYRDFNTTQLLPLLNDPTKIDTLSILIGHGDYWKGNFGTDPKFMFGHHILKLDSLSKIHKIQEGGKGDKLINPPPNTGFYALKYYFNDDEIFAFELVYKDEDDEMYVEPNPGTPLSEVISRLDDPNINRYINGKYPDDNRINSIYEQALVVQSTSVPIGSLVPTDDE